MIELMFLGLFGLFCFCYLGKNFDVLKQLKLVIANIFVWILKKRTPPVFRFDFYTKDIAKYGIVSLPEAWHKENPRILNSDINASDSLGFCGICNNGSVLVVRITRRHCRVTETWIYLRLPSGEEYQLPNHPDTKIFNTKENSFSAGGLSFEILEPLRRWRVIFNGYLRRGVSSDVNHNEDNIVPVRFNFIWQPIYNYLAFPNDFKSDFLAELIAKQNWTRGFVSPFELFSEESIEQLGQLHGEIFIENETEYQLLLRGLKERRHGTLDWSAIRNRISIQGVLKNGTSFHILCEEKNGRLDEFLYGYVLPPCNMYVHHIEKFKTTIQLLLSYKTCPEKLNIAFTAGKQDYVLDMIYNDDGFIVREGTNWDTELEIKSYTVTLNGKTGRGIIEFAHPYDGLCPLPIQSSLPFLKESDDASCKSLVVHFDEVECHSSNIVGGKGASVAIMSRLPYKLDFTIPEGVCLTKNAFEHHMKHHPAVKSAIIKMENVAWQKTTGSLSDECENVMNSLLDSAIPTEVKNELRLKLLSTFGEGFEDIKFAVRSSAIGEDGDEISAAGQNETYLGIKGFHEICSSVMKCWASQFSFRSVEYKRQNGQLLNAGMGVVIQRMVPAEVAGVLFTRDPLTGSMGCMTISSNYGLGESVVSATADPDIITLKRSWNDKVTIQNKAIGKKKLMISLSDDSGTVETDIDETKASECTLSNEMAIRLGKVAIFLEKCFGSARDIEWAISQNIIYVLQSRPVTTENRMTDFEIIHEFDSVMKTDDEHFSKANVGEILPGVQSPLSYTTTLRVMMIYVQKNLTWKMQCHRFDPTVINGVFSYCYGHCFLDQVQMKAMSLEKSKGVMNKALDIALHGRVLDDNNVMEIALERFSNPPLQSQLTGILYSLKGMAFGSRINRNVQQEYENFPVPTNGMRTSTEAYKRIGETHMKGIVPLDAHVTATFASSLWNLIILNLLSQGTNDYTTEQYTDFSLLIGAGNGAESGEVPSSMKKLATQISKEISPLEFSSWPPEEAYQWLCNNNNESSKKFVDFIKRHGHRGMKEFDVKSISWGMKPTEMVKILQTMLSSGSFGLENIKENHSITHLIDSIQTPISLLKRKLLTLAVNGSCYGICCREQAKSNMIKFHNCMRLAFRQLANMMVNEGLLPDPELLFFLTFEEIGIIIKTRSANLIRRAKQRYRMYPVMDKMSFPELTAGFPKPIDNDKDQVLYDDKDIVKGFPVSHGIVQGPAKVVSSFHEVDTIKPGDILITYSTDIGWSPYFPMLAGVVTEIGGLISHGAVVAREFGLPCIVGAENATRMFKTGDVVLLNASKGTLSKVI